MNEYPKISEGILGEQDTAKTNTELFLSLVGQYFPEAIKDGEVDFAALKEEMGEFSEVGSEHYDFTWAGKQAAKKEALGDIYGRTLRYKSEDSLNPDTTENIYIEGDNLEALKLLRRNYHGKIKMIYIDPPYNTGNDFVYRDDFSMTEDELAELSGDIINGERLQKNSSDSFRYHTNWLNMMYPRLKLARELLSDDGVIFISIDDNEQENLKKICDEVFGESNFVGVILWKKKTNGNNMGFLPPVHDYIICFSKNIQLINDMGYPITKEFIDKTFSNPDNDSRGPWTVTDLSANHKGPYFEITNPITGERFFPPEGRYWVFNENEVKQRIKDGRIIFGRNGTGRPVQKVFACNRKFGKIRAESWWDNKGMNSDATSELLQLFGAAKLFTHPKPSKLIYHLTKIVTEQKSIILDFFSGSATTAHAVMQLNAEDGGHRKFIMVQLPEETDEKSEAYKAGYKNICEIGKERIRRAAKKIHEENPDAKFDDGFKVFTVADTTIRWNNMTDEQIESLSELDYNTGDKDNIDFTPGHNDIDIVYEIMLRQYDIPLSTPIEKLSDISGRTYIFADTVVVCLEPEFSDELVEKLAAIDPLPAKFVVRDSAFGADVEFKERTFRKLSGLIAGHQPEEVRKSRYNNYTVEFI